MKRTITFVVVSVLLTACTERSPTTAPASRTSPPPSPTGVAPTGAPPLPGVGGAAPTTVATPTPQLVGSNAAKPPRGVAKPLPLDEVAASLTADADGWFVYRGTATSTVAYYNVCGTYLGQATYTSNVDVFVGPPLRSATGEVEQNPFYLQLGPPASEGGGGEGAISLSSAGLFPSSYGSQSLLLQYWSLQQNESSISGSLYDEHSAEAATANLLTSVKDLIECQAQFGYIPWTWPVARGTTLQGTLDDNGFHVRIDGNVIGGIRPFSIQIDANRVG